MGTPFCTDCPDREACMSGWSCEEVRRVGGVSQGHAMTAPLSDDQRDRLLTAIYRDDTGTATGYHHTRTEVAAMLAEARAEGAAEVVQAVTKQLDDADQVIDSLERPNYITVWGVRRTLMEYGGKPHRWPVPAEYCAECDHRAYDHTEECCWGQCGCLLSQREAQWGRDEDLDDTIRDAIWEDAVTEGQPWAMQDRAALADPEADHE